MKQVMKMKQVMERCRLGIAQQLTCPSLLVIPSLSLSQRRQHCIVNGPIAGDDAAIVD